MLDVAHDAVVRDRYLIVWQVLKVVQLERRTQAALFLSSLLDLQLSLLLRQVPFVKFGELLEFIDVFYTLLNFFLLLNRLPNRWHNSNVLRPLILKLLIDILK